MLPLSHVWPVNPERQRHRYDSHSSTQVAPLVHVSAVHKLCPVRIHVLVVSASDIEVTVRRSVSSILMFRIHPTKSWVETRPLCLSRLEKFFTPPTVKSVRSALSRLKKLQFIVYKEIEVTGNWGKHNHTKTTGNTMSSILLCQDRCTGQKPSRHPSLLSVYMIIEKCTEPWNWYHDGYTIY